MSLKRRLITTLPSSLKRLLAVPYDYYQEKTANRAFSQRTHPSSSPDEDAPDHIVLVVVDALRADHVDAESTPFLNALNGTNAITPGTWTFPAVSSVLTGMYPHEHGAMRQTDDFDETDGIRLPPRIDSESLTLTSALAGAGYETYGGFGHDTPFIALSGQFHTHALYHTMNANADDVLSDYLDWASGRDKTFAFLHLADPHGPVDPPTEYWDKYNVDGSIPNLQSWAYQTDMDCDTDCQRFRRHRRRLYKASVDYVDDAIARFHEKLEEKHEDTLFLATADHGEAHWEHLEFDIEHFDGSGTVDHGGAPYEEITRVPLMTTKNWNLEGTRSLVDLMPRLLGEVGIHPEIDSSGYPLQTSVPDDRVALVEGSLRGHEKKAVYRGAYKLIASKGHDFEMGFDLPEERQVKIPSESLAAMQDAIPPWPDENNQETEVSEVVEDRLEQLGYT